jgi:hypothetical protein
MLSEMLNMFAAYPSALIETARTLYSMGPDRFYSRAMPAAAIWAKSSYIK